MLDQERIQKILRRHKSMKREKQPWLSTYQICGEYIFLRRQDFTRTLAAGQFLTGRIFDGSAPRLLHKATSALNGMLWPGGQKNFVWHPSSHMRKEDRESDDVKNYWRRASQVGLSAINHPQAGFDMTREELQNDLMAFGISGIAVFQSDDPGIPLRFVAVDTKKLTIDENQHGFVDTVYIEKEMTVRQLVQEYGFQNVSTRSQDRYKRGDDTGINITSMVKVLHAIEPRMERSAASFGNQNMPIASIHIEIDANHILKESGFPEMPVFVSRFYKCMSEKYGRSPGMEALPDILEINSMREAIIIATEKILNPPIAVTQDGAAGGGIINTSAGAINVRTINGRIGDGAFKWIEPIMTVGDIKPAKERILEIEQTIKETFLIDVLTDLTSEQRMTAVETNTREKLRGQSISSVLSRQVAEIYTPLIQRVFSILLLRGDLGYAADDPRVMDAQMRGEEPFIIPEPVYKLMMSGQNVYDIEYLTPAERIMRSEELMGIQQVSVFVENWAKAGLPQVIDNIDVDRMVERIVELTGAPADIVMSTEAVKQMRAARSQAQQKEQDIQQGHIQAQTSRGYGQAMQAAAKAGVPPMAMVPQQPQQQDPNQGAA